LPNLHRSNRQPILRLHHLHRPLGRQGRYVSRDLILAARRNGEIDAEDVFREEIRPGVGELPAVERRLFYQLLQCAISAQERDAEATRLIDRMHEQTSRTASQRGEVRGTVEVIAVEDQKAVRANVLTARTQGV